MAEVIESWSSDDKFQFLISESGTLLLNEPVDARHTRGTVLTPDEALDLLAFLKRFEHDIFERMPAPDPPASESERWHQWRKEHGFE